MRLRRVHLGSLLVLALALAGATVVSGREVARSSISITWQSDDVRQAPVVVRMDRPAVTRAQAARTQVVSASPVVRLQVRHPLFQRPPPISSSITHS